MGRRTTYSWYWASECARVESGRLVACACDRQVLASILHWLDGVAESRVTLAGLQAAGHLVPPLIPSPGASRSNSQLIPLRSVRPLAKWAGTATGRGRSKGRTSAGRSRRAGVGPELGEVGPYLGIECSGTGRGQRGQPLSRTVRPGTAPSTWPAWPPSPRSRHRARPRPGSCMMAGPQSSPLFLQVA
jgi:hypothetical protein